MKALKKFWKFVCSSSSLSEICPELRSIKAKIYMPRTENMWIDSNSNRPKEPNVGAASIKVIKMI